MKQAGIYSFVNLVNGKRYIGQAVDLQRRFECHLSSLKKGYDPSVKLQRAWDKYGCQNFVVETLISTEEEYTKEYLKSWLEYLEKDYIQYYNSQKDGYNCSIGGESALGCIRSEETKEKIRKANIGKKHSEETKKKIGLKSKGRIGYWNGKKKPEQTERMKISMKGENNPMFGVHRFGKDAPNYGKKYSEEVNKRNSERMKALWLDPEYRENQSIKLKGRESPNKGKTMTEEQKLKISDGLKKHFKIKQGD